MILKIVYGPNKVQYFMNIKEINFISNLSDDAPILGIEPDGKIYNYGGIDLVYVDKDYMSQQIGCCSGDEDNTYYLNIVTVIGDDSPKFVAFTGSAYLCDNNGKTVDTLR